jgi:pimeloyl-ACP methyl ester carboxylesterase
VEPDGGNAPILPCRRPDETMNFAAYFPYRTEAARDLCFRYLDGRAATLWPIVSEQRLIPTTFGETFVRIGGPPDAPPLFLLHGAGTTSLMWAPNVEALSTEYRTVAVDQVGEFGRSLCSKPVQTFQDLTAWLDELIRAIAPRERVSLAGISYGGALAARYALDFPERIDKLVLLAPAATVLRIAAPFWIRLIALAVIRERGLRPFFRWVFPDMARLDPQWIETTVGELSLSARNIERHRPPFPAVWTDGEWGRLHVNTLFLVGEHEVIYAPAKAVSRLERVAPQVTSEIVPGAGHDLTFSQSELVARRILRFLNDACAASSRPCDILRSS